MIGHGIEHLVCAVDTLKLFGGNSSRLLVLLLVGVEFDTPRWWDGRVKMSGWEVGTPHGCTGMVRVRARGRPIVVVHGAVCEGSGSERTICGRPS